MPRKDYNYLTRKIIGKENNEKSQEPLKSREQFRVIINVPVNTLNTKLLKRTVVCKEFGSSQFLSVRLEKY